jgi:hypothetical protein
MRPAGYMAKFVEARPDWLACPGVSGIYSVSNCISDDFCDYINFWKHNGYWFFDNPAIVLEVASEAGVKLKGATLFYYEAHELEFDQEHERWQSFDPAEHFPVDVVAPSDASLEGFDVVSFYVRSNPECSPLSCNSLAESLPVNEHCLFGSFAEAVSAIESGQFRQGEPGPLRVFSVHTVPWCVA